ncbi:MAG: phosphoglycerate mutase, partial [Chloroflexota bacterium]|nr:phosphoglycerate mutase [Chloroflexota bacterium]
LTDSDPQQVGVAPREVSPLSPLRQAPSTGSGDALSPSKGRRQGVAGAGRTAALANQFIARARSLLKASPSANMVLLRGFSLLPHLPPMGELYRIRPAAIAAYPMYRGLARIVGMEVLPTGDTLEAELETLAEHYEKYDFFYVHFKKTDRAGEDGDFEGKVQALEEVDRALPRLLDLKPEVVVVTGDHSTPALLKGHSWHPVPLLISSPWCRPDEAQFSERACARGSLGHLPATQVMPLALAHALKLTKYGA